MTYINSPTTYKYFTKYFIIKPANEKITEFDIEITEITDSGEKVVKREYNCSTRDGGYYILVPYCIIKDADISKERSGSGYIESSSKGFKIRCYENLKHSPKHSPIEFYYKEGL